MDVSILIIISLIITIILVLLLVDDELNCSGELHLDPFVGMVVISLIPAVNLIVLIWFLVDNARNTIVIYRRDK